MVKVVSSVIGLVSSTLLLTLVGSTQGSSSVRIVLAMFLIVFTKPESTELSPSRGLGRPLTISPNRSKIKLGGRSLGARSANCS